MLAAAADSTLWDAFELALDQVGLERFPSDGPWVLIGGIAVFVRLGSVTRPTADADTVARSQAQLLDRLVAEDPTVLVSNGDVTVAIDGVAVQVDVMDLADEPLPPDIERRSFDVGAAPRARHRRPRAGVGHRLERRRRGRSTQLAHLPRRRPVCSPL